MATLLSAVAGYCIDDHPEISLSDFYEIESMPSLGYCSHLLMDVFRETAIRSELTMMAQCLPDATQDDDMSRALRYMQFAQVHAENFRASVEQLFIVALAREVKRLLAAERDAI